MASLPSVGFVGLGNMGGPMCLRLVTAGYPVTAFDLNPDALARTVTAGAKQLRRRESARHCRKSF
jgi:3-hydroxyisobutyrate dehydrogenase